jgi:hypothetical protein
VAHERTSGESGLILAAASDHGAWRGGVLFGSMGLVFVGAGIALWAADVALIGAGFDLLGVARAVWWARVCSTGQLVDLDDHLVWMYRGERRDQVQWADLRHVVFDRYSRHLLWAFGPRDGGPFPYVMVDSRADPPPRGFRCFAEVMIIHRAELEAADQALHEACRRRGVTYHGVGSGW